MRGVKSPVGRVGLGVLLFVVATLTVMVPVGVLGSSNLVWGEDNQSGRVEIPGTKVLHLPGGSTDVSVAVALPGRGNETPDLPLPANLSLTLAPVGGAGGATITKDLGSSSNANDNQVDTQRRVWRVKVPSDGDYRVTARGNFLGVGVNPQLWFGHGPPIPGTLVPVIAVLIVLVGGAVWFVVLPRVRGRGRDQGADEAEAHGSAVTHHAAPPATPLPDAEADSLERLERVAALHERGELTDDEFSAEKAKIIGAE